MSLREGFVLWTDCARWWMSPRNCSSEIRDGSLYGGVCVGGRLERAELHSVCDPCRWRKG
jgi:hypothetical protein